MVKRYKHERWIDWHRRQVDEDKAERKRRRMKWEDDRDKRRQDKKEYWDKIWTGKNERGKTRTKQQNIGKGFKMFTDSVGKAIVGLANSKAATAYAKGKGNQTANSIKAAKS